MAAAAEKVADHESCDDSVQAEKNVLKTNTHAETCDEKAANSSFGFETKSRKTDLTLIVEGRSLYVNRTVLEMVSSVFEELFESKLKDTDENIVKIADVNYSDFVEFLACVYPSILREVTAKNVCIVAPLAFRYSVHGLLAKCESVLMQTVDGSSKNEEYIVRCIKMANQYGMQNLKQRCIDVVVEIRCTTIASVDNALALDYSDKGVIFEALMPKLRSDACRIKFLMANADLDDVKTLNRFKNAKYLKEEFKFRIGSKEQVLCSLKSEIWGTIFDVSIAMKVQLLYVLDEIHRTNTLVIMVSLDKSSRPVTSQIVALNCIIKNHLPGKKNICQQEQGIVDGKKSIRTDIDRTTISNPKDGFNWNGEYTCILHLLVDKPST